MFFLFPDSTRFRLDSTLVGLHAQIMLW